MKISESEFTFVDGPTTVEAHRTSFVLHVARGIESERDLYRCYITEGRFPGYFGENWDAFFDCLKNFEWIEDTEITIWHDDLPFERDPNARRIYVEILRDVVSHWQSRPQHSLSVVFPTGLRSLTGNTGT